MCCMCVCVHRSICAFSMVLLKIADATSVNCTYHLHTKDAIHTQSAVHSTEMDKSIQNNRAATVIYNVFQWLRSIQLQCCNCRRFVEREKKKKQEQNRICVRVRVCLYTCIVYISINYNKQSSWHVTDRTLHDYTAGTIRIQRDAVNEMGQACAAVKLNAIERAIHK